MNPIGIMQGRLSPQVGERIQAFPAQTWTDEFPQAREAGLDCIEWVYEAETEAANPFHTVEGVGQIRSLMESSGVAVWSICADFYMTQRLVARDGKPQDQVVEHLCGLLDRAGLLGLRYIVLPFVDESSLHSSEELEGLLAVIRSVIPCAERAGTEIHLETDLQPAVLVDLLERASHSMVRANYDIGNSAALGRNPVEELTLLGPRLGSVHVKDRLFGGGTVPPGTGAADFDTCFRMIAQVGYRGPFILQAAREEGLAELELAKRNRDFVRAHMEKACREN